MFETQLQNLISRGYRKPPAKVLAALKKTALASTAPYFLVIPDDPARTITTTTLDGKAKPGKVDRNYKPGELATFVPIVELPSRDAYLVFDVDRGEEFCNVPPQDALAVITGRDRTPLTIDEGIALITHYPALLEKNKCFMLAGSRSGDRRVPAIWISEGAPKLGWCWAGNPHTWLGTASCGGRG